MNYKFLESAQLENDKAKYNCAIHKLRVFNLNAFIIYLVFQLTGFLHPEQNSSTHVGQRTFIGSNMRTVVC